MPNFPGLVYLTYGTVSYAIFFATFLYLVGFLANVLVPKSIDSGLAGAQLEGLLINTVLIAVFGLQHSIMARPWFKKGWTKIVPKPAERSTYVLLSSLTLMLLYWQWRPLPQFLWHVENGPGRGLLTGLMYIGFAVVLIATFTIDHFDLFGLRQVFLRFRNTEYFHRSFVTPGLYKLVRHPLYLGFLIAFWATPDMTQGHALFALGMTGYIFAAMPYEEHDLTTFFGADYEDYKKSTPAVLPSLRRRK
jgi:protein-S-isoprenylcysteine O-methyltransferase Ste14